MISAKKDFFLASLIGFLAGWLVLPTAANVVSGFKITPLVAAASVTGFTVLAPALLAFIYFLARFWPVLRQFGKFCAVGTLNSTLGFFVINSLISFTGITRGIYYSVFVGTAFLVSTTNSYFWNKFWSFQSKTAVNPSEYSGFLLASLVGFFINTGVASFLNNVIGPLGGIKPVIWANLSALTAVAFSFLWNFTSYRLIIFKKK
jgi:putative flippase GtrA